MENNNLMCENCLSTDIIQTHEEYECRNCGAIWTDKKIVESIKTKEFKINDYLSLILEYGNTNIYIKGRLFQQCKFLLINIPVDDITSFNDVESIDEAAERLDRSLEGQEGDIVIPPETEFWGHCSNLQVWYENNYDTRLLHSNLAFPLLRALNKAGDVNAKRVFREEIFNRYLNGIESVQTYLIEQNYLAILNDEEFKQLIMELIERENFSGLDLLDLTTSHQIKFKADETRDLIFASNYEFKTWVKKFLENRPNAGWFIHRILFSLFKTNPNLYKMGLKKCFFYVDNKMKMDLLHITSLSIFSAEEKQKFFDVIDFKVVNDYSPKGALKKLNYYVENGSNDAKQLLNDKIKEFFNDRNEEMIHHIIDRKYLQYLEVNELKYLLENFDHTIITEQKVKDPFFEKIYEQLGILAKFGDSKANTILKEEFFKRFREDLTEGVYFLKRFLSHLKTVEIEHLLGELNYDTIINQDYSNTFIILSELMGLGISKAKNFFYQKYGPPSLVTFFSTIHPRKQEIPYEKKLKLLHCILNPSELNFLKELQSLLDEDIKIHIDPRIWDSPSIVIEQKKISQIRIVGHEIEEIPKSIGMLNSLKILNINHNRLTNLPIEIGRLTSLEELLLRKNTITELPKTIRKLTSLQKLDLARNKLNTLPRSITKLKRLKYLNLNFNSIQTWSKKIGNLRSLEYLFCDYNQLKNLPDSFHKLRNLRRIDLQGNKLKTIPRALLSLNSIKKISLSRDYLDEETINLLEPIKLKHSLFVRNADRNHLGRGGLTDKSEVEPLNILFGKHILQFYYEYGGLDPIIFWAANDETESKYGDPVRLDDLPLSDDIMEKLDSLYERYNLSYKQDDESDLKEFKNETRDTYLKVIKQLGSEFQVKFSMKGYDVPYEG